MLDARMFQRIALRVSLTLVFSLIGLVLLELLARSSLSYVARRTVSDLGGSLDADPEMLIEYTARGRRFVPNADVVIHNHYVSKLDVDIRTNSIGLRDIDRAVKAAPGKTRILFLGDSIVAQDYLPSAETLSAELERRLNQGAEGKFEVINAGLSNSGIDEQYQLLTEVIVKLNPDIVLLSFYLNDSRPAWGFSGEIGSHRGWWRKNSIIAETITRELEVRKWLKDSNVNRFEWIELLDQIPWRTERDAFIRLAQAAPYDWGSAWNPNSWTVVSAGLSKIKLLVGQHQARLGMISMPVAYQVQSEFIEDTPQRKIAEIAQSLKVPHRSMLEIERASPDKDIFFDWCHPNQRGNQLIAPAIADFVRTELGAVR